jgi:hypothetical protein
MVASITKNVSTQNVTKKNNMCSWTYIFTLYNCKNIFGKKQPFEQWTTKSKLQTEANGRMQNKASSKLKQNKIAKTSYAC